MANASERDTSVEWTLSNLAELEDRNSSTLLPTKSRKRYTQSYQHFMNWRQTNNVESFSENVLLSYFTAIAKNMKPSTLWVQYAMIRSTIMNYHKINIGNYRKLREKLKRFSIGYKPDKPKTLSANEIDRFLHEAPDRKYLFTKVALIVGITGACRRKELFRLTVDDIKDLGSSVVMTINNGEAGKTRSFVIMGEYYNLYKKYAELRPSNVMERRFFLNYQRQKCTRQPVGINKLGAVPKQVAEFLQLKNPELYNSCCFRQSSVVLNTNGCVESFTFVIEKEDKKLLA